MIVIGVTGGIASGKSFISCCFARLGATIFSADKAVHSLLRLPSVIEELKAFFPDVILEGKIDRSLLSQHVFRTPEKRKILESILHPKVRALEEKFIRDARRRRASCVVLEIPLLFETGADTLCDYVILARCRSKLQYSRALRRPGMTEEKLYAILTAQGSIVDKARRSDIVVNTGLSKACTFRRVKAIWRHICRSVE